MQSKAKDACMDIVTKRPKLSSDGLHQHQYQVGDFVSLKIDKVNRSDFTSKVLPCKIISVQSKLNDATTYQLYTTTAIISSRFQAHDLLNLYNYNFRDLCNIDPKTLLIMSFIQICNPYISTELINPAVVCNCKDTCTKKKRDCEAAKIQCGTECHSSKRKRCSPMYRFLFLFEMYLLYLIKIVVTYS